jgi:hypothetical protein
MKDTSVRTLRSLFVLILAGAITLTAAILHGRWTNRWSPPEALSEAGQVLERLPGNFGPWQLVKTEELSPNVRGILECRDYRQAYYQNHETGEQLLLTLLLGSPGPMSVHTPEVCYTSIDSQAIAPRQRIELPTSGSPDAVWMVQFRELHEAQSGITRVYYAWSDGAGWSADEEPRVTFGGRPFLFKVQVCVRLPEGAEADTHDPARAFFPVFLPAFAQAAAGLQATDAK